MLTPASSSRAALAELRQRIERVSAPAKARAVLPFGIAGIDSVLPASGLGLGALHEICDGGPDAWRAPLAALFTAGIVARLKGPVLWCLHSRDLFAPALARVGLHPDRVIYCETWKDSEVLPAMEDGLRYRGLAGVVGELTRLPLAQSRRLQLAAEASGVVALVLRRSGAERDELNEAVSRWRTTPVFSTEDGTLAMWPESHSWVELTVAQPHIHLALDSHVIAYPLARGEARLWSLVEDFAIDAAADWLGKMKNIYSRRFTQ